MVEGAVFIGAAVVGLTEFLKRLYDRDARGALLIAVAAVVGGLVGAFDVHIGVTDISVAEGVMAGLAAAGVYQVARQVG